VIQLDVHKDGRGIRDHASHRDPSAFTLLGLISQFHKSEIILRPTVLISLTE